MQARKYQNFAIVGIVVTLVAIAMAMAQYKIPTVMTSIMASYSLDAAGGSWLMSIFTLMMVFTAIPFGTLANKVGARKVMLVACAVIIVGSVIGAFSPNAAVLMTSRAIEGIAITAVTICGPVLIESSVQPDRTGSALGIWGTWGPLGSTIAALITPTLYFTFGMTVLWIVYAAVVAVTAIILVIVVKPVELSVDEAGAMAQKPRYHEVFTKSTLLFFVGFAAFNICMLAVLSFVPTILQARGMDATLSGFVSIVPMILSVISCPLFGALSDKTGKTKFLLVLAVAFLGPCTFLLYTQQGAGMWAAAVLMGLVGMGSSGLMIAAFMQVLPRPELKTIGMGVFITVQGIGQFLGTFLVQALLGPALDQVVLAGVVVMLLGFFGALCLALAKFAPRKG